VPVTAKVHRASGWGFYWVSTLVEGLTACTRCAANASLTAACRHNGNVSVTAAPMNITSVNAALQALSDSLQCGAGTPLPLACRRHHDHRLEACMEDLLQRMLPFAVLVCMRISKPRVLFAPVSECWVFSQINL
jgi:hypothetical protein